LTGDRQKSADAEFAEQEGNQAQTELVEQAEEVGEEVVTSEGEEEEPEEPPEEAEETDLTEELEKVQAQAAEYLDGWQRTQAEFSNYKKRQEAERAQTVTLANATLLRKLLPVVDDFVRALETMPSDLGHNTWVEGIVLIKHKLDGVLESEGVKPIEAEEQAFDPRYHEAVTYEETAGYEDGQIIGELQRGYTLGERVLRPALVRVAKSPAPQPEDGESGDDEDNASFHKVGED
jgi:molecular chaperone GrpE